jgi:hypothetical protein
MYGRGAYDREAGAWHTYRCAAALGREGATHCVALHCITWRSSSRSYIPEYVMFRRVGGAASKLLPHEDEKHVVRMK